MFIGGRIGAGMGNGPNTCGLGSVEPLPHPCRPFWSVADPPLLQIPLGFALFDGLRQNAAPSAGMVSQSSLSARASSAPVVMVTANETISAGLSPEPPN